MSAKPIVVIAGGGTGGHVFPGLAVAEALRAAAEVDVVFVGTARGLEARVIPERGYRLELLVVSPLKGGGAGRAVRGALVAARATLHAVALLRRLKPRAVLSVGGYAAGPLSLAAAALGIPMAILEPNTTLGLANRWLAPFAKRAYVAWSETGASLKPAIVRVSGVPLRAGFEPSPYPESRSTRVLVMGGSQGAAPLNDRLPTAIAQVQKEIPGVEVLHQAGVDRDRRVRARYESEGVTQATVVPFLDDVAAKIAHADVIVARAGAGTLAEIAAIGRASVLIPFPHAAGDHQAKNAEAFARAGGALAIRQEAADSVRIGRELLLLLGDPARRARMADAARRFGKPHAARSVADDFLELAQIEPKTSTPRGASRTNGHTPSSEVH